MVEEITLTRNELIRIYMESEKERRATSDGGAASRAFWDTKVIDIAARFAADGFLRRLNKIRCKCDDGL